MLFESHSLQMKGKTQNVAFNSTRAVLNRTWSGRALVSFVPHTIKPRRTISLLAGVTLTLVLTRTRQVELKLDLNLQSGRNWSSDFRGAVLLRASSLVGGRRAAIGRGGGSGARYATCPPLVPCNVCRRRHAIRARPGSARLHPLIALLLLF